VLIAISPEHVFGGRYSSELIGVHHQYSHETLTIAEVVREGEHPVLVGPLQHDEIDVGETLPARCLKYGLWLSKHDDLRFAVLVTPAERFGQSEGMHVEVAVPPGDDGAKLSREFLDEIEKRITQTGLIAARSYRSRRGAAFPEKPER